MDDREHSVQYFLDLIKKSHRGKFKVYIGMIAGVGKSYRMLQEAHELLENGVNVQIGYIETHGRAGTEALLQGLPVIPRRKIFYKGKELEEMDLDTIIRVHPEIVIVDELAHTNVEGSLNEKRWQDVITLLDEGINVISAINIQHIESVNEEVQEITGIEVKERVPDSVLQEADEVVNIDLTAEELIARLKAGKIYRPEKIQTALDNFFRTENILQLRELALKEVALRVEKKVENEVMMGVAVGLRHEKFMACISSHEKTRNKNRDVAFQPSWSVFIGSGGGTLFPAGFLPEIAKDKDTFMSICRTADDVWLNSMCRYSGHRIVAIMNRCPLLEIINKNNSILASINYGEENYRQQMAVREYCIANGKDPFEPLIAK